MLAIKILHAPKTRLFLYLFPSVIRNRGTISAAHQYSGNSLSHFIQVMIHPERKKALRFIIVTWNQNGK
ncbi:MAG: hypothetical protein CMF59_10650 [Leptospiraceae bacterium]|nr:hypothetical protein [Leptospiraceae bacterium]